MLARYVAVAAVGAFAALDSGLASAKRPPSRLVDGRFAGERLNIKTNWRRKKRCCPKRHPGSARGSARESTESSHSFRSETGHSLRPAEAAEECAAGFACRHRGTDRRDLRRARP